MERTGSAPSLRPLAAIACALLLGWLACGWLSAAPAGATILRITIRDGHLIGRQELLDALAVQEGAPFDAGRLDEAVRRWNELGTRGTVAYRVEPLDGGIELVLDVRERLTAPTVVFRGNQHFADERLLRMLPLPPRGGVSEADAIRLARVIGDSYVEAGFPLAEVRGFLTEVGQLVFVVSEGPRASVEAVVFEGNEQVPDDELLRAMGDPTRRFPTFIWPGWFREEAFWEALRRVETAYHDRGFLDVEIGGYIEYSRDMTRVVLHVVIYEAELYQVVALHVEGNTLFRDEELVEGTPLAVGEAFNFGGLQAVADRIAELYSEQGYLDVSERKGTLSVEPVFALEGGDVTIRITIEEGEPVFIGRIEIRGLTRTKESVVRRNLSFYPGERASTRKLKESEQALVNTGYFDLQLPRPVRITLEPDEGVLRDAIVRATEGPTGRFRVAGGLGTDSGLLGQLSVVEENFDIGNWPSSWDDLLYGNAFRGGGQTLAIVVRAGTQRSVYSVSYQDPAVLDSPYSLSVDAYRRAAARNEFDETRTGASVGGGEQLSPFLRRMVVLGIEGIRIENVSAASTDITDDAGSHTKPFVRYVVSIDRRDNRFNPSEGYAASAELEAAVGGVGTVRADLEGQQFVTVRELEGGGRHVVGVRGRVAVVTSYREDVPIFERLYAGGMGSLRGFKYEGVSPVDSSTGEQIGGESLVVVSGEYSLPLSEDDRVRLVLFADGGWVSEDLTGVVGGLAEPRLSIGVGVRTNLGVIGPTPLEIDLALPLLSQTDDETQLLHFSVGAERRF